jgi:hypothetical protein
LKDVPGDRSARFERLLAASVPRIILTYFLLWISAGVVFVEVLGFSGMRFDNYEMLLMGHEWQPVYWKHPAMPPWIAEAVFIMTGRSVLALYALPVAFVAAALWLTNRLSRPILGVSGAAIATMFSLGSWYVMTPILQFNHNIAQLPFWVLTVFCYRRAVIRPSYANWVWWGVVAALLLHCKYTGILLLGTLAAHMLWFEASRAQLKHPHPWLGILVLLTLLSPLLFYFVGHGGSSLTYSVLRAPYTSVADHILGPLEILGAQIFFHVAILVLVAVAIPWGRVARGNAIAITLPERSEFDRSLLIAVTAAPFALSVVFYTFAGVWGRAEAFGSMFMLVGPSVVACMGRTLTIARPRLAAACFALVLFGPPSVSLLASARQPYSGRRLAIVQVPYAEAARTIDADWRAATGYPVSIITGDMGTAGGLAAFLESRPSVLIDGHLERSPWITKQRIASEGMMVVWRIEDARHPEPPEPLARALSDYEMERKPPLSVKTKWDRYAPPVLIGRAIVRAHH